MEGNGTFEADDQRLPMDWSKGQDNSILSGRLWTTRDYQHWGLEELHLWGIDGRVQYAQFGIWIP